MAKKKLDIKGVVLGSVGAVAGGFACAKVSEMAPSSIPAPVKLAGKGVIGAGLTAIGQMQGNSVIASVGGGFLGALGAELASGMGKPAVEGIGDISENAFEIVDDFIEGPYDDEDFDDEAVSYTHLTLPTICSV